MIGERLGAYAIQSELGSGGMGKVYLASGPGGAVALKVVHPHLLETPGAFKRFLREAEIGAKIDHPNVVRTLDVDAVSVGGTQFNFLVMEYVEGQTLRGLLDELGRVPEDLCRHIGLDIAGALDAIHAQGVVHRDLKPENVLITPDHAVKVMDLGVAQLADAALRLSQTGAFLGSVLYAAPEQFHEGVSDHRADLYALGLMLYELATGQHPWRAGDLAAVMQRRYAGVERSAAEINPQLSPFFEEIVHTLLAPEPDARFASAAELRGVLEKGEQATWWAVRKSEIRERTKRPLRRVRVPRETAVYGRDDDLARLGELFEMASAGDGQVLLLEGEAGIGKTRLIDEFVARLGADVNFLFGSYPPGGAATEAGAFSTAFREHLGDDDLSSVLEETPVLAPAFAALLRGEPAPPGEQALNKDSLQTVFIQTARALARERTTIVLIDDLHFAPPEGRALFAALAMGVPGHRLLLVGTARPGLPDDWTAGIEHLSHATRLPLQRLGAKDLAKLLVDFFRSERLANELSFRIATKSDGNPFFVFEIIRGLREGKFITQTEDGSWATSKIIEQIEIPSSVADLISARISTLSPDEHEILDVAACCGFEFDASLVAEVLDAARIPTFRSLARIEKEHRLVRAAGRHFVFDHHQVQEALYAGLPEMLREEYHTALGNVLEEREPRGSDVVALCEHFFKGRRPERAKPHLDAGLDHLAKNYLVEPGLELLDRALAVPGLYEGAERVAKLIDKSRRLNTLGRREEELATTTEALKLADEGDDLLAKARARVGLAAHMGNTSQFDEAERLAHEILALGEAGDSTEVRAMGHEYVGILSGYRGHYDEAQEHMGKALALQEELDDPRGKCNLLDNQGVVQKALGNYDVARKLHERSRDVAKKAGHREGVGVANGSLGILCKTMGLLGDALDCFARCTEEFRQIGSRRPLANGLANLGQIYVPLGDLPRAKKTLAQAAVLSEEIRYGFLAAWCQRTLGQIAMMEGRNDDAEALLTTALERMRSFPSPPHVAEILTHLAELSGERGLLEEALAVASEGEFHPETVIARATLALMPGGDAADAVAAFETHKDRLAVLQRMRVRYALWQATNDRQHLDDAHRLLCEVHDHAPEAYRETMIANVPLHRGIMDTR